MELDPSLATVKEATDLLKQAAAVVEGRVNARIAQLLDPAGRGHGLVLLDATDRWAAGACREGGRILLLR